MASPARDMDKLHLIQEVSKKSSKRKTKGSLDSTKKEVSKRTSKNISPEDTDDERYHRTMP
jgi:hypothetical protein